MIPFEKLGLASSVAKAWDFSWDKTIELASRSNFQQIQLYLSEQHLRTSTASFLKNVQLKFTVHLHLPPSLLPEEKWNDFLLLLHKNIHSRIYLIQHQPFGDDLNQFLNKFPFENFLPGIENDLPNQWPLDFLNWFLKVKSYVPEALPVVDVPRFFHQAAPKSDFAEIAIQVIELIRRLQQMNKPFILHAIDHPINNTDRLFWQLLLLGELPWSEILNLVKLKPDLLKCLMFEYENWNMVQDSIQNLKNLKL